MRGALCRTMIVAVMLSGLLCFVGLSESVAFENGNYNTPDTWTQQVSPGQLQESYTGTAVGEAKVYTSLTTRYRLQFNDYANDQDMYQYLRVRTDPIKLGQGTASVMAFARFGEDINGDNRRAFGDNYYYFYRDALDAESRHKDGASRLYLGTVSLDNVIPNTKLNLGRVELAHQNTFQMDGADAQVKLGDAVSIYAYGGKPVSFYYQNTGADTLAGGGATVKAAEHTTLGAEYIRLHVQGDNSDYTKLRLDQGIPNGRVALGWTMLDASGTFNAEVSYEVVASGTILTTKFESLLKDVVSLNNYVVNPLTNVLSTESRYNKYEASVYQAFLKNFATGVTFTQRSVSGVEDLNNRSYTRVGGKFDISGLPSDNTYISFSADYWGVASTPTNNRNDSIQYGVQLNQKVTSQIDAWCGTSYNRYDYDVNSNLNLSLNPSSNLYMNRQMDWARSYFVGAQYKASKHLSFMADVNLEHGSFFNGISNDLNTNYTAEFWANFIF